MVRNLKINSQELKRGLYVVSTPIGNLGDITLRGLDILKNSNYILCEDTRNSKILLNKYEIKSNLIAYHKFNEKKVLSKILELLKSLKNTFNITMIFVSHDLAVVKSISDEVMVLKQGEIVEKSSAEEVFNNPKDEYTKKLISSVPRINNIG